MDDSKQIIKDLEVIKGEAKVTNTALVELKIIQAQNQVILQEHMRRTEINEKHIERLENFKWYFAGIAVIITAFIEFFRRVL